MQEIKSTLVYYILSKFNFIRCEQLLPSINDILTNNLNAKLKLSDTIYLKAGQHYDIEFHSLSEGGYFLFEVETVTTRNELDEIRVYIFDDHNYNKLLSDNKGKFPYIQEPDKSQALLYGKSLWGTTYHFTPIFGNIYHLVLDNSNSQRDKTITFRIFWCSNYSDSLKFSQPILNSMNWGDLWEKHQKISQQVKDGDYSTALPNIQKMIIVLWSRVCEKISGQVINITRGKEITTKPLEDFLISLNVPHIVIEFIKDHLQFISKLSQSNDLKNNGVKFETGLLVLQNSIAISNFLLSLVPTDENKSKN